MAKQTINIGTRANDGSGDTIRVSFGKTNNNFTELYSTAAAHTPAIAALTISMQAAFDKANAAYVLAQTAFQLANTANNRIV